MAHVYSSTFSPASSLSPSTPLSNNSTVTWSAAGVLPSVVLGLCCVLGVPGNMAVLVVLGRRLKGGSFTLHLMMSLAVSDLVTLLTLPFWIAGFLRGWLFGSGVCKLLSYVVYWSVYTSVMTVTFLSIQRFIQVLYSHRWAQLRSKGKRALLAGLWVLGGLLALPYPFTKDVVMRKNLPMCQRAHASEAEYAGLLLYEVVAGFIIPFTVMVVFYSRLHHRVNKTAFFSSPKLTRLVTRIIVTFFVLYIPIQVNNFLRAISIWLGSEPLNKALQVSLDVAIALTFINSCVNPFLYAFASQVFVFRLEEKP
ncbi:leukotriene B4 receptor 1-like [Chanos chanos]|uniref:Leukotriene B4 receptor 1-like n=1 Tax=Chanos chanos TaxID=29144 RepID=A0A6J2WPU6_CHACN|nr:leukotriene B4 receptor 1-like [Chanos chanos]